MNGILTGKSRRLLGRVKLLWNFCTEDLCEDWVILIMISLIENKMLMKIHSNYKHISTPIKVLTSVMMAISLKCIQTYYQLMVIMVMKVNLIISNWNKIAFSFEFVTSKFFPFDLSSSSLSNWDKVAFLFGFATSIFLPFDLSSSSLGISLEFVSYHP